MDVDDLISVTDQNFSKKWSVWWRSTSLLTVGLWLKADTSPVLSIRAERRVPVYREHPDTLKPVPVLSCSIHSLVRSKVVQPRLHPDHDPPDKMGDLDGLRIDCSRPV